jgi:hypothetical protein
MEGIRAAYTEPAARAREVLEEAATDGGGQPVGQQVHVGVDDHPSSLPPTACRW